MIFILSLSSSLESCAIVSDLITECQIIVRLQDALNKSAMMRVFSDCVSRYFREPGSNIYDVYRVADILSVSSRHMHYTIAAEAASLGSVETLRALSREICNGTRTTTRHDVNIVFTVRRIVLAIASYLSQASGTEVERGEMIELVHILQDILKSAILASSSEALSDISLLLRSAFVLLDALDQCEIGHFEASWEQDGSATKDAFSSRWFNEEANVLNSNRIIPALTKLMIAQHRWHGLAVPSPALSCQFVKIVKYLCDNRNSQLALAVLALLDARDWTPVHSNAYATAVADLVRKVLTGRTLDTSLSHGYLLAVSRPSKAYSAFKSAVSEVQDDYERLRMLACIGIDFCARGKAQSDDCRDQKNGKKCVLVVSA